MFRRTYGVCALNRRIREGGEKQMLGAKGLAAALTAILLVPAASANPGKGNGNGQRPGASASAGVGETTIRAARLHRPIGARQGRRRTRAGRWSGGRRGTPLERTIRLARCVRILPQVCKAEREEMGDEAFAEEHGVNDNKANAFGKCVSEEAASGTVRFSGDEATSPEYRRSTVIGSAREPSAFAEALAFVPPGRGVDEGAALARDNLRRALRRRAEPRLSARSTQKSRPRLRPPRRPSLVRAGLLHARSFQGLAPRTASPA